MRRMLIVDDEQDICDCLTQFFSTRGFAVSTAWNGEGALEQLAHAAIDVVLLDILLPGLSGIEVLKRAKVLQPRARIVMVSGIDQTEMRLLAQQCGASGYIIKPFDFALSTWSTVFANPTHTAL